MTYFEADYELSDTATAVVNKRPKDAGPYRRRTRVTPEGYQPPPDTSSGPVYASFLRSSLDRIEALKSLPENWNSYGASSISPTAISMAKALLCKLQNRFFSMTEDRYLEEEIIPQAISPIDDGGIQLDWYGTRFEIEIEIGPTGSLGYLFIEGSGANRTFDEGDNISVETAMALVGQAICN
jgi:hypothetical protein